MRRLATIVSGISGLALLASCSAVSDGEGETAALSAKPATVAAAEGNPDELLWGDIHLHTEFSMDANTFGARLTPDDAYRFAKGEAVTASNGMTAKLDAPLDFLMVADHSDNLGSFNELRKGNPELLANPTLAEWFRILGLPDRKDRIVIEGRQTNQDNPKELDNPVTRAVRGARAVLAIVRLGDVAVGQDIRSQIIRRDRYRSNDSHTVRSAGRPSTSQRDNDLAVCWLYLTIFICSWAFSARCADTSLRRDRT